jgi:hypothetical protein
VGGAYCKELGGCGTVFEITPGGELTTLRSLCINDAQPYGGAGAPTDDKFYGTTYRGGATSNSCNCGSCGSVFSLAVGLGPFVEAPPTSGEKGTRVIILELNTPASAEHRQFFPGG